MLIHILVCALIIAVIVCAILLLKRKSMQLSNYQPFSDVWNDKNKFGVSYRDVSKDLFRKVITVFEMVDAELLPAYGTLLGFVRHGGLIPWDDDIDVWIKKEAFDSFDSMSDLFDKYGIRITKNTTFKNTFYKLSFREEMLIKNRTWSWPFIDVFSYYTEKSGSDRTVVFEDIVQPYKWTFKNSTIYPLRTNIFEGDIYLHLPNNVDEVLSKLYSASWETVCISSNYNHRNEQLHDRTFTVDCGDLKPVLQVENIECNSKSKIDFAWVINLKRRPDRWLQAKNRLEEIGIQPLRWDATDAKDPAFKAEYDAIPFPKRTAGEVACYQSHINLWKHIYKTGEPFACIFEDDIFFTHNTGRKQLESAIDQSTGFGILFFGHCYSSTGNFHTPETRIGNAMCLHAYAIKRSMIEKLINSKPNYAYPIDVITNNICKTDLCFVSHTNNINNNTSPTFFNTYGKGIVLQDNELGSDLRKKRTTDIKS